MSVDTPLRPLDDQEPDQITIFFGVNSNEKTKPTAPPPKLRLDLGVVSGGSVDTLMSQSENLKVSGNTKRVVPILGTSKLTPYAYAFVFRFSFIAKQIEVFPYREVLTQP